MTLIDVIVFFLTFLSAIFSVIACYFFAKLRRR